MSVNEGYINLTKSIFSGRPFDSNEPESKKGAYLDLALMANFSDRPDGTKRGQLLFSYRELAERWKWSLDKTHRFIRNLTESGLAKVDEESRTVDRTSTRTHSRTLLTLVKYDFQRFDGTDDSTPTNTVGNTYKEPKIEPKKNIINNINTRTRESKVFQKPTVDEVRAYCQERHNKVDAEQFVDFYESKGWRIGSDPMKDWKAAVRTWEKRRQDNGSSKQDTAPVKKTAFHNFEERHTDYDALFADLQKKRGVV